MSAHSPSLRVRIGRMCSSTSIRPFGNARTVRDSPRSASTSTGSPDSAAAFSASCSVAAALGGVSSARAIGANDTTLGTCSTAATIRMASTPAARVGHRNVSNLEPDARRRAALKARRRTKTPRA